MYSAELGCRRRRLWRRGVLERKDIGGTRTIGLKLKLKETASAIQVLVSGAVPLDAHRSSQRGVGGRGSWIWWIVIDKPAFFSSLQPLQLDQKDPYDPFPFRPDLDPKNCATSRSPPQQETCRNLKSSIPPSACPSSIHTAMAPLHSTRANGPWSPSEKHSISIDQSGQILLSGFAPNSLPLQPDCSSPVWNTDAADTRQSASARA